MSDTEDQTEAELEKTRRVVAETVAEQSKAADGVLAAAVTDDETDTDAETDEGWSTHTKEELADELRARGLAVSGSKDELVARLDEDDAAEET